MKRWLREHRVWWGQDRFDQNRIWGVQWQRYTGTWTLACGYWRLHLGGSSYIPPVGRD